MRCFSSQKRETPFRKNAIGLKLALEDFDVDQRHFPGIPKIPINEDIVRFFTITGWLERRLKDLEKRCDLPKNIQKLNVQVFSIQ